MLSTKWKRELGLGNQKAQTTMASTIPEKTIKAILLRGDLTEAKKL